ncbi:hypothetical protein [Cryobacterium sp. Y57]|uniref:hypothetical protein n=1 Tax=Cryobacterium sp. Y57 TaxID=2048287 RepID=UPI000CE4D10F|nr:hypothetical protein [Cryobacterium sp. Y57]
MCTPFSGKDFPFQKTYHFPRRKVPVDAANIVIPDGVIGTTELTIASGDNTIAGIAVITAGNGGFDVALEDFRLNVSGVVTANGRDRVGEVVQAGSLVLGSDIPIGNEIGRLVITDTIHRRLLGERAYENTPTAFVPVPKDERWPVTGHRSRPAFHRWAR